MKIRAKNGVLEIDVGERQVTMVVEIEGADRGSGWQTIRLDENHAAALARLLDAAVMEIQARAVSA